VLVAFGLMLEQLIPEALAAQADIDINTPAIRAIRSSMQRRQASLAPFFRSGTIGFDSKGSVVVRDVTAAPLKDRNRLKKQVADENADRASVSRPRVQPPQTIAGEMQSTGREALGAGNQFLRIPPREL